MQLYSPAVPRWLFIIIILQMMSASGCAAHRVHHDGYFIAPRDFVAPPNSLWEYTTSMPSAEWRESLKKDVRRSEAAQEEGVRDVQLKGGDVSQVVESDTLWLRRTFTPAAEDVDHLMFWGRWDDSITIYVNGTRAVHHEAPTPGYRYLGMSDEARAAIKSEGSNILAVHIESDELVGFFDLGIVANPALANLPQTGFVKTEALADIPALVKDYMELYGIPSGVLAVRKGENLVVSQGFGYMDKEFTRSTPPDAVFRLASNDKTVTRDAIHELLSSGATDPVTGQEVTLSTPVFPLIKHTGIALLAEPNDPRVDDITVDHLLTHRSGLPPITRQDHKDLLYISGKTRLGELDLHDNVTWLHRQKLEFAPGSQKQYSSTGYMVLRYLIYALSGDLEAYLRGQLFDRSGAGDIYIAHERLEDRVKTEEGHEREPWYATLEAPYARWIYLENFTALAASAPAFVQYDRHATGDLLTFGSMAGTWTAAAQVSYGDLSYAVFFNIAGRYDDLADKLRARILDRPASDWGPVTVPFNYNTVLPAVQTLPSL